MWAEQNKLEMIKKFPDIEVAVSERRKKIFDQPSEGGKFFSPKNLSSKTNAMKI